MTNESAILRAYALLSQERYDEAEQMLKGAPGALNTPAGADLFARLRFEQGFAEEARQIWERINRAFPDFDPANKALAAFISPPEQQDDDATDEDRRKFPLLAILFLLIGGTLAAWGLLRKPETIVQVREHVLTNMVDRVVEVPVTSFVTSVVERTSVVTDTVTVVKCEVQTNTIEKVVVKEVEKIVYKEPVVVEAREEHDLNKKIEVSGKAANESAPPKQPNLERQPPRRADRSHETWIDRAIKGLYTKLGLLPE